MPSPITPLHKCHAIPLGDSERENNTNPQPNQTTYTTPSVLPPTQTLNKSYSYHQLPSLFLFTPIQLLHEH
jgi:hypothetical protein